MNVYFKAKYFTTKSTYEYPSKITAVTGIESMQRIRA